MKLSLIHACPWSPLAAVLIAASALLSTGCGDDEAQARPAAPAPTVTPPPTTPEPPPAKRTMTTAPVMGTAADNLVFDPTFGSLGGKWAMGVVADGADAQVEVPATSPAGVAQPVLVAKASGDRPVVVLTAQGGLGQHDVRVFVSVPDGATPPPITLATTSGEGWPLEEVKGSTERHGDRTYRLFATRVADPLYGMVYLVVEPPSATPVTLSAPRMTRAPGGATMSALARPTPRISLTAPAKRGVALAALKQSTPVPLTGGRYVAPEILAHAR